MVANRCYFSFVEMHSSPVTWDLEFDFLLISHQFSSVRLQFLYQTQEEVGFGSL